MRDAGRAVRDFIYIDDLAEALTLAGLLEGLPPVINIGAGKGYSLREVLDEIERQIDSRVDTVTSDSRIIDIPASVLDVSLASEVMNFVPAVSLSEGIRKTLRSHDGFWHCMDTKRDHELLESLWSKGAPWAV